MIAEVYPFLRMPRSCSFFDYEIPEHLPIRVGDLVTMPFRGRVVQGVVKQIHEKKRERAVKAVLSQKISTWMNQEQLSFLTWASEYTLQSIPSLLATLFPKERSFKKRTPETRPHLRLRNADAHALSDAGRFATTFHQALLCFQDRLQQIGFLAAWRHRFPDQKMLIATPTVSDAASVAEALRVPIVLSGETPTALREKLLQDFATGKEKTLVGTNLVALLPPLGEDAICVLRAQHPSHQHTKRAPFFDARDLLEYKSKRSSSRLFILDVLPTVQDALRVGEEHVWVAERPPLAFADMSKQGATWPAIGLCHESATLIEETLRAGKRICCVLNKKGVARALICKACGFLFHCPNCGVAQTVYEEHLECHHCRTVLPLPLVCHICGSARLGGRGVGNRGMQQALQKLFPGQSVAVFEKQKTSMRPPEADILLVTQWAFEEGGTELLGSAQEYGACIHLDADTPLLDPQGKSFEKALWDVAEFAGWASRLRIPCLIQTRHPGVYQEWFAHPLAALKQDIRQSELFHLPPFWSTFRLTVDVQDAARERLALAFIKEQLSASFSDIKISSKTTTLKKGQRLSVEVRIPKKNEGQLRHLLHKFPSEWHSSPAGT